MHPDKKEGATDKPAAPAALFNTNFLLFIGDGLFPVKLNLYLEQKKFGR